MYRVSLLQWSLRKVLRAQKDCSYLCIRGANYLSDLLCAPVESTWQDAWDGNAMPTSFRHPIPPIRRYSRPRKGLVSLFLSLARVSPCLLYRQWGGLPLKDRETPWRRVGEWDAISALRLIRSTWRDERNRGEFTHRLHAYIHSPFFSRCQLNEDVNNILPSFEVWCFDRKLFQRNVYISNITLLSRSIIKFILNFSNRQ